MDALKIKPNLDLIIHSALSKQSNDMRLAFNTSCFEFVFIFVRFLSFFAWEYKKMLLFAAE